MSRRTAEFRAALSEEAEKAKLAVALVGRAAIAACRRLDLAFAPAALAVRGPLRLPGCRGRLLGGIARNRRRVGQRGLPGLGSQEIAFAAVGRRREDRKSTRLNSSHLGISYAVFCLK